MTERTEVETRTSRKRAAPAGAARRVLQPRLALTRAHLSLAARPSVRDEASAALDAIRADWALHLGTPVDCRAVIRDATLAPLSHLGQRAVFAVFELANRSLALVEFDPVLVHGLLRMAAGSEARSPGPVVMPTRLTRIEEAALGWLLLSALAAIRGGPFALRFGPKWVALHTERTEALGYLAVTERHLAIDLDVSLRTGTGLVRVIAPALAVQSLVESAPEVLADEPLTAPALSAATLPFVCVAGRAALSAQDCDGLIEGDVVVFRDLHWAERAVVGPARLVTTHFELGGRLDPDTFTLTDTRPLETPMPTDPAAIIDLEIELTRLRVPLHQLGSLKTGTVLPLHLNVSHPVTLRVGDRAIAKAELVDIEGEIGARILTLF